MMIKLIININYIMWLTRALLQFIDAAQVSNIPDNIWYGPIQNKELFIGRSGKRL